MRRETIDGEERVTRDAAPLGKPDELADSGPCQVTERSYRLEHTGELVLLGAGDDPVAEKFQRLKTKLGHGQLASLRTLLVTSPVPGDGKSTIALNLALAFATNRDVKTILVDCDLRRPSLRRWLRPSPQLGIESVLSGDDSLDAAICRIEGCGLHVLPTISHASDAVETLTSSRFAELLDALKASYDRVILDTPPIVPFPDADALGALADGILIVVRAGETPKRLYERALESLHSAPIVGAVLNGATRTLADRGGDEGDYYYEYYKKR